MTPGPPGRQELEEDSDGEVGPQVQDLAIGGSSRQVEENDDAVKEASELDEPQERDVANGGSSTQEVEDSLLQVGDWKRKTRQ